MNSTKKGLSLFALTMIAIGSTIGSGIFQTPSSIAQDVPNSVWIISLWVIGGLVSMVGALVFAELGSRFPKAGGVYAYLNATYGTLPAFLYGWCLLAVVSSGTIAALIVVFTDNVQFFLPFSDDAKPFIAAASIVLLTLFNIFGIKSSEWFANISTVLKIIGIYALLLLALFLGEKAIFGNADTTSAIAPIGGSSLAKAFVGVLWSYTGWHYASFVAGDAINPKRNVPRAMIFGTLIVTLTYVLCNLGYMRVLDIATIQSSDALAATTLNTILPGTGHAIAILIALSVFGCAGLYILATPRIIQQMSAEKVFFKRFAVNHPKFGVPLNAILLQSAWAIVLVFLWGKFEALYTYVTITEWFFLLLTCFGIFIVRARVKKNAANKLDEAGIFKSPLYPLLPVLFCGVISWFIYSNATSNNSAAYFGLLVIPIGIVFYYVFKAMQRKDNF